MVGRFFCLLWVVVAVGGSVKVNSAEKQNKKRRQQNEVYRKIQQQ